VAKVCADKQNLENSVAQKAQDDAIAMVNTAHAEGKMTDENRDKALAIAKENPSMAVIMVGFLQPPKNTAPPAMQALIDMSNPGQKDDRAAWTFKEWQKADMKGLLEMKAKDLPRYEKLFSATGVTVRED
jgi:hypothetical protein